MKPAALFVAAVSLLIAAACTDEGTEPDLQGAVAAQALSLVAASEASVLTVNVASVATGVDIGPQDGSFDSFTIPNLGSVNNNGFTSFRTAFQFDLVDLPTHASINSATLTFVLGNPEGTRSIQVHGYAGNGTVQLGDVALDGLVGKTTLDPGAETFGLDVTDFIANLVAAGGRFAGFNVREEPANTANFIVMSLDLRSGFSPTLSIVFSTEQRVEIDIKPGGLPNSINLSSRGTTPVAILSSATFDAPTAVDPASLTFGRTGNETSLAFCGASPEDVNGDGFLDTVCHFRTSATGFLLGDMQGVIRGKTRNAVPIRGTDSVRIIG